MGLFGKNVRVSVFNDGLLKTSWRGNDDDDDDDDDGSLRLFFPTNPAEFFFK